MFFHNLKKATRLKRWYIFALKFARLITVQFSRKTKIRVIKKTEKRLTMHTAAFAASFMFLQCLSKSEAQQASCA